MLYRKNVGWWERWLRALLGVALMAVGTWLWWTHHRGLLLAASGLALAVTGWVGFCPACAMFGRKLQGPR